MFIEFHPCDAWDDDSLWNSDEATRLLAEEAAKGYGAGEAGKVDEDGGGQGLPIQTVLEEKARLPILFRIDVRYLWRVSWVE